MTGYRIGSLFAGIGGLELGLERAGVGHTIWQVEIDPYCRAVLAKHWPNARRFEDVRAFARRAGDCVPADYDEDIPWCDLHGDEFGDCACVGADQLADECGDVDVICGGFPCQDISYAGKGTGLRGERSGLWFEFARVIGELGPRFVVVENVAALLTRGFDAVLGTLADLGYDAEWSLVRASDVGAPHRRERVFVIAWLADAHRGRWGEQWQPKPAGVEGASRRVVGGRSQLVDDADGARSAPGVSGSEPHGEQPSDAGVSDHRGGALVNSGIEGLEGHRGNDDNPPQQGRQSRPGQDGPTSAPGVPVGWSDARPVRGCDSSVRLVPAEVAQAGPQSPLWPVAHGVPGRVARLRAIGNAVVPQVAEVVGRRLLEIDAELRAQEVLDLGGAV